MPWPPACRPRTGPRRRRTGARQYHGRPSSESRRTLRSPDSDRPLAGRARVRWGRRFRTTSSRCACHNRVGPVVRKSSEVLRLVDDVVDAALILDVNLGVRAHLRDHRESLGEWGVRVVLVGDPLGKRVGHAEPAVGGDRWLYDCVCVGVVPCIFERRNRVAPSICVNRTHRLKATG